LLKLKRIELQGFKSFCERTELRFNGSGIAAIVGPNGCGKSNISDAISWVLGEQSAKSLRGARMEDVIFAGTRDRKPLGMAYVTMTLVDPEHYTGNDAHKPKPSPKAAKRTRRGHHHAAPLPLRRKRIPHRRPAGAPARHPGPVHGHRPGPGKLRHHRAGPHRADPQLQAAGPPRR
jgi:energy-coupling factor transporter ATP-binding protein EcfA2